MTLVSVDYVRNILTRDANYTWSHGAKDEYLGAAMICYSLVYANRARFAVVLGSGSGFIPRVVRQAQRDIGIGDTSQTVLVDGDMGDGGRPDYYDRPDCIFRKAFPEIILIKIPTAVASDRCSNTIDYLHIDADHTYDGVKADWRNWSPLVTANGIITLHDTRESPGVKKFMEELQQEPDWGVCNLHWLGCGLAIATRQPTKIESNA